MSASTSAAVEHTVGDIHVEVRGEGRPVLLIHGNSGDLHFFDRNVPMLARRRRVVAMDCRGNGLSARGTGPLTIARMAEDAAEVIRALGDGTDAEPEPFDIVGFSDGANVAMLLVVRHPELVRSLVLNSGNSDVRGLRWVFHWSLRIGDAVVRWRLRVLAWLRVTTRMRVVAHRLEELRHRHEELRLMLEPLGIRRADLARIAVPTLVLAGTPDVVRLAHTRAIARRIPGAQLRIIRGGTHLVLRERAATATALIEAFLQTASASGD